MIGSMPDSGTGISYIGGNDSNCSDTDGCKHCDYPKFDCICWMNAMDEIERIELIKSKRDIYKRLVVCSVIILVVNLIRRTPTAISGMKGLALLKSIDKR